MSLTLDTLLMWVMYTCGGLLLTWMIWRLIRFIRMWQRAVRMLERIGLKLGTLDDDVDIILPSYTRPPPLRPDAERMRGTPGLMQEEKQELVQFARIVAIAEPLGPWTAFVTRQQMGFLMARMQFQTDDGFWVNFVNAQESASLGQNKGRGGRG
jgi:hypothetical protein